MAEKVLTVFADDDFKLGQVRDVLTAKLAKRGVDVRCLDLGKVEKISGNKVKQTVTVQDRHRAGRSRRRSSRRSRTAR